MFQVVDIRWLRGGIVNYSIKSHISFETKWVAYTNTFNVIFVVSISGGEEKMALKSNRFIRN